MSWRDDLPVHPAAEFFPMMAEADLVALGEDIKQHGLKSPIAIRVEMGKPILLDGRNRLDAMERAGLRVRIKKGRATGWKLVVEQQRLDGSWFRRDEPSPLALVGVSVIVINSDPVEFITSANVHRRHLMPGEKRDVIAALLKENPERSNLQTAKIAGADDKTVASVRRDLKSRSEIPNVAAVVDTKGRRQATSKPKAVVREPTAAQVAAQRKIESRLAQSVLEKPTNGAPVYFDSACRPKKVRVVKASEPTKEDHWQRSVQGLAGDAIGLEPFWSKEFGDAWKSFPVPTDLVTLARQAADAWAKVAADLAERAKS
jgi:hypothetical protein